MSSVRLDDVPMRERFDFWWETVARSVVAVDASSDRAADFQAEMKVVDLGLLQVSHVRCDSFEARRTPRRIRQSDPGLYQLSLTLRGRSGMHQERRECALGRGDLMVYDASRTFHAWTVADGSTSEGLIAQFPHTALPLPTSAVDRLLAVRLSGDEGIGALLAGLLCRLMAQPDEYTPADAVRLAAIIIDLVAALLAHELDVAPAAPLHDPRRVLLLRIQSFIEQNLARPDLSPATLAAAHHLSVRSLQALFQEQGTGVADWIRRRRLERCRRDLADPAQDSVAVGVVGARWGFVSASHFTRAFRAAYGVPPAAYRRHRQELTDER
ncbi:helix-turn-helix domain-containing protein [Nonomuraea sp. SYSU D8015]|uniref:AraC-like ligand-binding domain-containing protein n=1 Tax=Nonomuraea sp. SYSU D8015 TaxID=2593644 RepID=UPI0016603F9D|nr:helix-turn-helix domain-containing protein [Nonomuraea sp. SYSU D8015]